MSVCCDVLQTIHVNVFLLVFGDYCKLHIHHFCVPRKIYQYPVLYLKDHAAFFHHPHPPKKKHFHEWIWTFYKFPPWLDTFWIKSMIKKIPCDYFQPPIFCAVWENAVYILWMKWTCIVIFCIWYSWFFLCRECGWQKRTICNKG